jgi:hypothetical protein
MPIKNPGNDIDAEPFDRDGTATTDPRLYRVAPHVVTTAHPFSADDLRAFVAMGDHMGLE